MMTADELEDAPQAQGLLAYEREPIHLSLGVTIENLVKVPDILTKVNFGYSEHPRDFVLCPEERESAIPGVIFSQTSIDGGLNFVRNSECP